MGKAGESSIKLNRGRGDMGGAYYFVFKMKQVTTVLDVRQTST